MSAQAILWISFNVIVLGLLALDLGVIHRKSRVIGLKEALFWSVVWILIALAFWGFVAFERNAQDGMAFLTGYLLERALSMDNLFVFLLIFSYFRVAPEHQHKVLFWGILGALVMRAVFIFAGVAVVRMFHWMFYVFGVFLIYTGVQMVLGKDKKAHPEKSWLLRAARKVLPVTPDFEGDRFFARHEGKLYVTPMFIVLLVVESSDVVFAVDSIPAILGITTDPFLVYSSNVFAILGLRAFYFAIAGIMPLFKHLHYGLSLILVFIGVKMLIANFVHIPVGWALTVVAAILAVSMVTSSACKK